ncbi:MAG: inositol-3-phosphate synthase [Candidatus Bathyarchaeota archaeon]|nr:MAG: inositol-3-phosphate synthase [Candidatus Bathyarchaeota archaeon]
MGKIRVALAGVGNCASGLTQGLSYYREEKKNLLGLRKLTVGDYFPWDIELVSAFDIDARKVGQDLSHAIFAEPNNAVKFAQVPKLNVPVHKGRVLDGVGEYLKNIVVVAPAPEVNVPQILKQSGAEILINLLPSGATEATRWYAEKALEADCGFINVTPTSIASDPEWAERFERAKLPVVGDDLVDQIGATTLHRTLLNLLSTQGVHVSETYQLDVGGGTESLDTLERTRETKRKIKTETVKSALPYEAAVVAGTTDYVDFMQNRRDSYLSLKGTYFGGTPLEIELRLSTVDATNAGAVLFDVIRAVKLGMDRGEVGILSAISAYAFKHPPIRLPLEVAMKGFENFISQA